MHFGYISVGSQAIHSKGGSIHALRVCFSGISSYPHKEEGYSGSMFNLSAAPAASVRATRVAIGVRSASIA